MMYFIHYPAGGFGHYMLQMSSLCFESVFCPQDTTDFSKDGNSHGYPEHCKIWFQLDPYEYVPNYDFGDKVAITLIDSGIHDDEHRHKPNTIRMCIDTDAVSIVWQTCREKANLGSLNEHQGIDWEHREKYSLLYHNMHKDPSFYLNNFKPHRDCININISDLVFEPNRVVAILEKHFGTCDQEKFNTLHNEWYSANAKYFRAQKLVNAVKISLAGGNDFEFEQDYSLHDQGYLIYWLERQYNIQEIPPWDYKDWFKNTQEVKDCLNSILSQ